MNVFRQLAELLLAAAQGLLGLLALGDIRAEAHVPQVLATRRQTRLRRRGHPPPRAVRTPQTHFGPERGVLPYRAQESPDIPRRILRVQQRLPVAGFHLGGDGPQNSRVTLLMNSVLPSGPVSHSIDGQPSAITRKRPSLSRSASSVRLRTVMSSA